MVAATSPDPDAIVVEDNDSAVSYTLAQDWTVSSDDTLYTGHSYHLTYVGGAMVEFKFTGSHVWFGADKNTDHGNFTVQIDSGAETQLSGASAGLQKQQILYQHSVDPGLHVLRIKNAEDKKGLGVDYFAYLPLTSSSSSSSSSSSPSVTVLPSTNAVGFPEPSPSSSSSLSSSPSQAPSSPEVSSTSGGLATGTKVGIALGAIGVVLLAILAFLVWRDRREIRQRRLARQQQAQPWIQEPSVRYASYTPPPDTRYNSPAPHGVPMSALPSDRWRESLFSVDPPDTEADVLPGGVPRRYFARSDHTPSVAPTQFET